MPRIITLYLVLVSHLVSGQELKELRHTHTSEFKMDFYITFSEKKVKYEDTLHYFWFRSQKIHNTQGSSEGNLLHGPFSKFYYSGQLAEQGHFEKGLKTGEWKQWYESGNLMAIYNYNDGLLSGSYTLYNDAGDIKESGKIRKGEKKVDGEKESWLQRRRKIKEALNPEEEKSKEEKKAEKEQQKQEKKAEKERIRAEEGNFIERLFNFRFEKKEKKPKRDKEKKKKKEKE